ncbi:ABC transporter permease [Amycolatopsis jejuensis]|uniref:ABC transporter permease n=1 Tax=Amycolatopsis jejuensis TaxID=330084 RepID=UPI00068B1D74|nr:ABC transporter permease [Amycolatopsis jejuensis]
MTAAVLEVEKPARTVRRGTGKIVCGGVIVALFVLAAVFAPLITTGDPLHQDLLHRLAAPSAEHPLGTDQLGRDAWTRLVYAARIDLRIGILGTVLPAVLGSVIGMIAGFGGRALDAVIMRISDVIVSFPLFIFFLALVGLVGAGSGWFFLGPGEVPMLIGFTVISWIVYARLLRTEIRRVRSLDYIRAATTGGLPRRRIVLWHVLPNAIGQTVVYVFVDIGLAIVALSTLSFLGVGIPIDTAEWGAMISASRGVISTNWWLVAAPGFAIALLAMGLALVGDGLDDRLKAA